MDRGFCEKSGRFKRIRLAFMINRDLQKSKLLLCNKSTFWSKRNDMININYRMINNVTILQGQWLQLVTISAMRNKGEARIQFVIRFYDFSLAVLSFSSLFLFWSQKLNILSKEILIYPIIYLSCDFMPLSSQVIVCSCLEELYEHIEPCELTPDLGGDLEYHHEQWLQQRVVCITKNKYPFKCRKIFLLFEEICISRVVSYLKEEGLSGMGEETF